MELQAAQRSNSITPQGDGNLLGSGCSTIRSPHVQIPLPRKGTETFVILVRYHFKVFKFHYPARGRKPLISTSLVKQNFRCSNSITPQGDGNLFFQFIFFAFTVEFMVQIPLPRKGTETDGFLSFRYRTEWVQIPLPRKGTETSILTDSFLFLFLFKFHYPARGRKQLRGCPFAENFGHVQIPLPRKGTETS